MKAESGPAFLFCAGEDLNQKRGEGNRVFPYRGDPFLFLRTLGTVDSQSAVQNKVVGEQ
jgi:hypothetical protein